MSSLAEPPQEVRNLSENFKALWNLEAIQMVKEYVPKDTDIILIGPPKSGTTWVQHVRSADVIWC